MTTLFVAVAFLFGVVVGLALWQFIVMPKLEARHLAELKASADERNRFAWEMQRQRSKVGHLKALLGGLSKKNAKMEAKR